MDLTSRWWLRPFLRPGHMLRKSLWALERYFRFSKKYGLNLDHSADIIDLVSAKPTRSKSFRLPRAFFDAASRDAFLDDGGGSTGAAPLISLEGIRNADAVAFSGEGLEHPERQAESV